MVYYFAQNCTIEAKTERGTYELVGAAQEVSFEMNFEDVKLYQFGDVKRADAARHSLSVPVTVKLAKFGNPKTQNDWFWQILNGAGWTDDGQGGRQVSVSNSSTFPFFRICGEFRSTDAGSVGTIYVTATDVYFKTFQWGGNIGEYIMENLQGEGKDIIFNTVQHDSTWKSDSTLKIASPTPNDDGEFEVTIGSSSGITLVPSQRGTGYTTVAAASSNTNFTATVASTSDNVTVVCASSATAGDKGYVFVSIKTDGVESINTITVPVIAVSPSTKTTLKKAE